MMEGTRARAGIAGVMLTVVLIVGLWLQPATAHVGTPGHLWTTHLRPLADQRYLQNSRVYVSGFSLGVAADLTVTRPCPSGWQAIGGGVDFDSPTANVQVISDAPTVGGAELFVVPAGRNPAADGWRVTMHNSGILPVDGVVGAICSR